MKVLLATQPIPAAPFMQAIAALEPGMELLEYRSALTDADLAGVDVVLAWQLPPGLATRLPRVRWICSVAAGVEKLLAPDLAPEVRVSRIVDREQAAGIGQFVVTMALRHARDLALYERQQQERSWTRHAAPLVRHRTLVLGTGDAGARRTVKPGARKAPTGQTSDVRQRTSRGTARLRRGASSGVPQRNASYVESIPLSKAAHET